MVNIVFMGTPDFAVPSLQALIETQKVVGVVTQPDRPFGRGRQLRPSPVKTAALAAGIPVYQPASLRKEAAGEPIREWEPDLIVVTAYGQILRPHILNLPPYGCLNVHASLLPRWRGAAPIQHAILAGDTETGVCLMQMDEGMDTGPVYVATPEPIYAQDTAASLHDRLAHIGADMLSIHLEAVLDGQLMIQEQDDSQATYAKLIKKSDGRLDWNQTAVHLDRQVRAMHPWPGAFTSWQGKRLKIIAAAPLAAMAIETPADDDDPPPANLEPGTIFLAHDQLAVQTSAGALALLTLQLAGKKALSSIDFLRGYPTFIGTQLGIEL